MQKSRQQGPPPPPDSLRTLNRNSRCLFPDHTIYKRPCFSLHRASLRSERTKRTASSAMMFDAPGNRLTFLADSCRKIAITLIDGVLSVNDSMTMSAPTPE